MRDCIGPQGCLHQLNELGIRPSQLLGAADNAALGVEQHEHRGVVVVTIGQQPELDAQRRGDLAGTGAVGAGQRPLAAV